MITDAQLTFSDNQAVTATAPSANQVDLTHARNIERGPGGGARFVVLVTTAFAGITSIQAQVRQSAAANMSSPDVLVSGPVVPVANATKGRVLLDIPWPSTDAAGAKRFLDTNYVVAGGPGSAGAVWAGIVLNSEGGEQRLGVTGR